MAKSRMIRPETWTDDKFVSLSPLARLLFIGMWNFACDNGHLDDSALQLRMRILPADNCDISELLSEVLKQGMVIRKDGYLKVVNLPAQQPLDLRFLVFCDHCERDPERRYSRDDKKPARVTHAGHTSAPRVPPTSARRAHDEVLCSGDGDGDVMGIGTRAPARVTPQGHRIPDDFAVTDEMRQWAESKGFDHLDLGGLTENFVDYWRGVPGAKGRKLDWVGTWRNWIRRNGDDQRAPHLRAVPAGLPAEWRVPDANEYAREHGLIT